MLSHSLQVQCQATFHKGQCYSRPSPKSSRFTQLSGPSRHQLPGRSVLVHGAGEDAVQGWIDLAQLVSSAGGVKGAYEKLANKIGKEVYMDVQGWHLYLKDASAGKGLKIAQALAQQLGSEMSQGKFQPQDLEGILKKVPVSLGGGKETLSLFDVIPKAGIRDMQDILKDFERGL